MMNVPGLPLRGFFLGLSSGTVCLFSCAPVLVPYLLGEGRRTGGNFLSLGLYLAGRLAGWMEPVFTPLGIDQLLSIALLFGFVAKEVVIGSLAVIYGAGGDDLSGLLAQRLDWMQAYSFMLFTLVYTPCLSALATLRQEAGGSRYMFISVGWSLAVAWLLSFTFYQTAKAFFG